MVPVSHQLIRSMDRSTSFIRPARAADGQAVADLLKQASEAYLEAYPSHYFLETVPSALTEVEFGQSAYGERAVIFMAETQERELMGVLSVALEGFASSGLEKAYVQADIKHMVVHPDFRRSGVGAALLEEAKTWAADRGATRLHVSTYTNDEGSLEFYRHQGFQPWTVHLLMDLAEGER